MGEASPEVQPQQIQQEQVPVEVVIQALQSELNEARNEASTWRIRAFAAQAELNTLKQAAQNAEAN